MRRTALTIAGAAALAVLVPVASAQTAEATTTAQAASYAAAINTVWTLIAAFLVFFMQAGFALVEAGFTRAKNACNIMMKNMMDFAVGSIAYWAVGFALMFGASAAGLFGTSGFFLSTGDPSTGEGLWQFAYWLFQVVFAATATTIVSGAVAERIKFTAYLVYSVVVSALIYPVVGHWIWGGGWLGKLGMVDFAGSTVVHTVGGVAGLVATAVLGPRLGRYVRNGRTTRSRAIPGHNIPLAALGVFILWFGWFGFNPGSTTSGMNPSIATIAVTTNLAAAAGAIGAMITVWIWFKKPDASMTLNGALAGLVAITASCALVSPTSAVIIGLLAGVIVVAAVEFFDKVLHVDDPVGAVSVHGACGVFGTLCVGLFAEARFAEAAGLGTINGLFFGGGWHQLGVQALGSASVLAWVGVTALGLFFAIKKTIGLRVTEAEEVRGLDIDEHGMEAYAGFQVFTSQ